MEILLFLVFAIPALITIAGAGDGTTAATLNTAFWAGIVMTSFPRAMLIMSGSFGFWRSGLISNSEFGACVAAVVSCVWLLGSFMLFKRLETGFADVS